MRIAALVNTLGKVQSKVLPFRFAVHSSNATNMSEWRDLARRAEGLGYSALYLTDHVTDEFDQQFGPLVGATVAAEATTNLHVGTLVLNNDFRNPVVLAKEFASLGLAAEGRVEVGLGAGFLRSDFEATGIRYDEPGVRVDRLAESIAIMQTLWSQGEVTFEGHHYSVRGGRCEPRPETPPRVIVGGGSRKILAVAAKMADIVNVYVPLGETRDPGAVKSTLEHFDRCLAWARQAAGDRFGSLELQIAPFAVMVAASRRAAARSATLLGLGGEEALDLPICLIGSVDEMCERLVERRDRWGFSNVVVPANAMEPFAPVVARLAGT
jgi:probable F420-dependent oxidoreductase